MNYINCLPFMNMLDSEDICGLGRNEIYKLQLKEDSFLFHIMKTTLSTARVTVGTTKYFEFERISTNPNKRRVLYMNQIIGYAERIFDKRTGFFELEFVPNNV